MKLYSLLVHDANELSQDIEMCLASALHFARQQGSAEEMAFGPTPAYSMSKAAANAVVRVEGPRLMSEGVRLVAVCPGNVLTRMCSEEEKVQDAMTPAQAAVHVVELALHGAVDFAGGFFRLGKRIAW